MDESMIDRRDFLKFAAAGAAVASMPFGARSQETASAALAFPPLPYAVNALEPAISARTVDLHYNKHHRAYYDLVAQYINNDPTIQKMTLEEIIRATKGGINMKEAQHQMATLLWNHSFYWKSMKPGGGVPDPKARVAKMVTASFGSLDGLKTRFLDEAMKFGVGWVWLVQAPGGLSIVRTDYHQSPVIFDEYTPLLACDVWEHAYYLDYQNDRKAYVTAFLDKLANWQFAETNLKSTAKK